MSGYVHTSAWYAAGDRSDHSNAQTEKFLRAERKRPTSEVTRQELWCAAQRYGAKMP